MITNTEYFKVDYKKERYRETLYIKLYLHIESQLISTKVIEDNLSNDLIHRSPELLLNHFKLVNYPDLWSNQRPPNATGTDTKKSIAIHLKEP